MTASLGWVGTVLEKIALLVLFFERILIFKDLGVSGGEGGGKAGGVGGRRERGGREISEDHSGGGGRPRISHVQFHDVQNILINRYLIEFFFVRSFGAP